MARTKFRAHNVATAILQQHSTNMYTAHTAHNPYTPHTAHTAREEQQRATDASAAGDFGR